MHVIQNDHEVPTFSFIKHVKQPLPSYHFYHNFQNMYRFVHHVETSNHMSFISDIVSHYVISYLCHIIKHIMSHNMSSNIPYHNMYLSYHKAYHNMHHIVKHIVS